MSKTTVTFSRKRGHQGMVRGDYVRLSFGGASSPEWQRVLWVGETELTVRPMHKPLWVERVRAFFEDVWWKVSK